MDLSICLSPPLSHKQAQVLKHSRDRWMVKEPYPLLFKQTQQKVSCEDLSSQLWERKSHANRMASSPGG